MINVYSFNFQEMIYRGALIEEARSAAIRSGFQCTLIGDEFMEVWSPVGGWHKIF
jgi:hypothetical protein